MSSSSFLLAGVPKERFAGGYMEVADGHGGFFDREAPLFDLGTIPAGNLFTTAEDLARFLHVLAAGGRVGDKQIVSPESLAKMWTPQLTKDDSGFGIAFMVNKHGKHMEVSHNGAVYGHSSALAFLPKEKIGVVLLCNDDIVNGTIGRLTNLALDLMLGAKLGEPLSLTPAAMRLPPESLAAFAGEYESPATWADFEVEDGRLVGKLAGHPVRLTPLGPDKFTVDGRVADGSAVTLTCRCGRQGDCVCHGFGAEIRPRRSGRDRRSVPFVAELYRQLWAGLHSAGDLHPPRPFVCDDGERGRLPPHARQSHGLCHARRSLCRRATRVSHDARRQGVGRELRT